MILRGKEYPCKAKAKAKSRRKSKAKPQKSGGDEGAHDDAQVSAEGEVTEQNAEGSSTRGGARNEQEDPAGPRNSDWKVPEEYTTIAPTAAEHQLIDLVQAPTRAGKTTFIGLLQFSLVLHCLPRNEKSGTVLKVQLIDVCKISRIKCGHIFICPQDGWRSSRDHPRSPLAGLQGGIHIPGS